MEDIHRDLTLLGEQGKAKGFLNNTGNADKLSGLVEDIRDAVIDYQVCALTDLRLLCSKFLLDIIATRRVRQELLAHCEPLLSQSIFAD